ncbi:MAG: putative serine protease PepD [Solirubrobacteraceae bacterium]|jgi:putative serine protease PepD|nr:putative serine protease PepD [Solirubrobacteraceae bacterium]
MKPDAPWARSSLGRSVAAVLAAAVIASAAVTGLLYAVGVAGGSTRTVVMSSGQTSLGSDPGGLDASSLYRSAAPGVVAIEATDTNSGSNNGFPYTPPGQSVDTGTGLEIDTRGDILTASHVVAGAATITVKFQNGPVRTASVRGTDTSNDVSVLHVNPSGLTLHPLPLGSVQSLVAGDPLAVIGDPFGYNRSLSTGLVSGLGRTIQAPNGFLIANALQTDAALNPGNSGGPVLDDHGQVVGIADQIATGGSGADQGSGVGFAIPIDPVKAELSALESGQTVEHPYLGASLQDASINQQGAQIQGVAAGSPAAAAGLRAGDLITALDGSTVNGPSQLVDDLAALRPGDKVTLTLTRRSNAVKVTATLAGQPNRPPTG